MKRFMSLLLALALTLVSGLALAQDYTLPEKLNKQVAEGSGLKGSITLTASGTSDAAKLIQGLFTGTTLEVRAIESASMRQVQAYFLTGETQSGLTQLFTDTWSTKLRTELMPGEVLTFDGGLPLLEQLTAQESDGNPSWYSAAQKILAVDAATWAESWQPVLAGYESAIEMWLNTYAPAPTVVRGTDGVTTMQVVYDVPVADACTQIMALVQQALQDAAMRGLLASVMTQEQLDAYVNPARTDYYAQVLSSLALEGSVKLSRTMSVQGEDLRTTVSLPLLAASTGFDTLTVDKQQATLSLRASGEKGTAELMLKTAETAALADRYTGSLTLTPVDGMVGLLPAEAFSGDFELTRKEESYSEEDGREHALTTWKLTLTPMTEATATDAAQAITLSVQTHYHSKNAKTSPTTLLITASVDRGEESLRLDATFKTTSPWVMQEAPSGEALRWADLDAAGRADVLSSLGSGALALVSDLAARAMLPAATQTDLEAATETDLEAAAETDAPVQAEDAATPSDVPEK